MRTVNKILIIIILVVLILFTAYFGYMHLKHQKDLRNYPFRYVDIIKEYAGEYSLDPYLVLAVIRCESSLETDAVSSKGAKGLMQIMPDTGKWIAHKLKLDEIYTEDMLFDAERNVEFGCWMLQFLSKRFGGDTEQIICAYNAGHKTVEKWLDNPEYSQDGVLTKVPYPDTARYLEKVQIAYSKYKELYPQLFDNVD